MREIHMDGWVEADDFDSTFHAQVGISTGDLHAEGILLANFARGRMVTHVPGPIRISHVENFETSSQITHTNLSGRIALARRLKDRRVQGAGKTFIPFLAGGACDRYQLRLGPL